MEPGTLTVSSRKPGVILTRDRVVTIEVSERMKHLRVAQFTERIDLRSSRSSARNASINSTTVPVTRPEDAAVREEHPHGGRPWSLPPHAPHQTWDEHHRQRLVRS
jgi:hypothetical protein